MGSLEKGISSKTDPFLPRSSLLLSCRSSNERNQIAFSQRSSARSRFARLFFPRKIDYVTLICIVAVFLFFFVIFQICLLGSLVERSGIFLKLNDDVGSVDMAFLKEFNGLEVVEDIMFDPSKVLTKYQKGDTQLTWSPSLRGVTRFSNRKPKLAMVFADLSADHYQVQMITIAAALRGLGYEIEVFSFKDGPVYSIWRENGILVTIISTNASRRMAIDWLNYDGILVNSLETLDIFSCLMQEPFKYIPVIWTIHEDTLAKRLRHYFQTGQNDLVNTWKKVLNRALVVVFHNNILPILYSVHGAGNYYVIPGSPVETWEAENFMAIDRSNMRERMGYGPNEFIIGIVGNQVLYKGMWLEHALVLQALLPVFKEFPDDGASSSHLKIIVLAGVSNSNYSIAVEVIALNLSYPVGTVKCISGGESEDNILSVIDVVVYSSFLGEQSFPGILLKAMSFEKPIVAPDLPSIRKYVDNRVNGYLFAKDNIGDFTRIMMQMVSNGKLSLLARNAAAIGKHIAKNLMVSEAVEGYALLLQNVLSFPSEVADVLPITKMPTNLKAEWRWHLFEAARDSNLQNRTDRISMYLDKVEKQWSTIPSEASRGVNESSEHFVYVIWNEEKNIEMANMKKRREEEELKDRTDQPRGMWEEVYKNARRADRAKNELHERDNGELERTGQPLCIYEPYFGEGTWPFLHSSSLYRGLGLSTKGRRPGADDIDGPSRLSLLNNPYYRDVLGEYGAFFAIGNQIDRIHKNAWIGFQSWRATARKGSLSRTADKSLLEDIHGRKHGDTLYFWSRMDMDPRNSLKQDFWTFCDAINAGNCQFVFSTAFSKMYGTEHNFSSLPPMPQDGDTWSVMHSWALPTKSFLEFVMFSRMFVDALDSQYYNEHHGSGHCSLSLTKDKHCYSRLLELLVNVWAYHSAKRMVYVNPETGLMQEQHRLKIRKGQMWLKWFQFDTLRSMDEDLAEEADTDQPKKRWIWPSTGEVFWQGIYDKERNLKNLEKEKRRQQSKDKISRIKKRSRQKTLGKYVKPLPEETENSNSTATTAKIFR